MNSTKGAHELQNENSRDAQGTWKDMPQDGLPMIHASAAHLNQIPGEFISSKLRDLDMRIQGSQNSPTSGVANAKWRTRISTRISTNLNHKHALKIVS